MAATVKLTYGVKLSTLAGIAAATNEISSVAVSFSELSKAPEEVKLLICELRYPSNKRSCNYI